jgi:hypothetical protein
MKKNLLLSVILFLIASYSLYSQEAYDLRFIDAKQDPNAKTKYLVTVQIKAPSSTKTFKMGNANITFNYNMANLSSPVVRTRYTFNGGAYSTQTVTMPVAGVASIQIIYYDAGYDDASATSVTPSWVPVTTIEFTILNASGCADFVFRNPTDVIAPCLIYNAWDIPVTRNTVTNEPGCPLPVELLTFNATPVGNSALLDWATASETNNYGFDVQRYNDGTQEWDFVSFVYSKATGGNSQKQLNYDLTDENIYNPLAGNETFYYRLKQVDLNGEFEYSDIRSVTFKSNLPMVDEISIKMYPNPVSDVLFIEIINKQNLNPFDLLIHDKFGKLLYTNRFNKRTQVDVSKMPQGTYSITIRNEKNTKTETFTVTR